MLKKKSRVDTKTVERIFKTGKFINFPNLTFKFLLNINSDVPRISFIVPKTVSKKAVERNSLRRKGYNVLGKYIKQFPVGLLGVFVFKKYQNDVLIIENEIKTILNKIN